MPHPGSQGLFRLWQEAGRDLGFAVRSEQRGGLIDGLGPRGESCHCSEMNAPMGKEQEWVDVTSFVPKTVLNASALLRRRRDLSSR